MDPGRYEQIVRIFNEALPLAPPERAEFLAVACGSDDGLRDQVAAMLSADASDPDFLEEPLEEAATALRSFGKRRSLVGQRLGDYEVLSLLGAGGMGEVYLAQDVRLRRKAALKLLPADYTIDSTRLQRFEQEAWTASSLNHPNIITVYGIGQAGAFRFLATELIEGETLRQKVGEGPMTSQAVIALALQVASALAAAHEAGVIHRDIKPENIMLRPDGLVKVLDFGVAKFTGQAAGLLPGAMQTTQPGMIIGTPAYMSPEQARGLEIDARSDVFSLGSVMFEMLTGTSAFRGDTPADVVLAVLVKQPPPISSETVAGVVSPELELTVRRCLEKEPDRRFQSARELLDKLRELERGDAPIPPANITRRQVMIGAGSLAATAVGAGGIYLWRGRSPQFDSVAVLPLVNATGNSENDYLCEGISESIINRLSPTKLKITSRTSAFQLRDSDPIAAGKRLQVSAVLTGRVVRQGNNLAVQAELVNVADGTQIWGDKIVRPLEEVQAFEQEMAKTIAENLRVRLNQAETAQLSKNTTSSPEAYRLYVRGQYFWNKFTAEGFKKAIESFDAAIAKDPSYARAHSGLAHAFAISAADSVTVPKETMPQAKAAALRALALDGGLSEAHTALGIVLLFYEWDWPAAHRELQRAMTLDPGSGDALHFYGHYLEIVGPVEQAIPVMQRAVDLDPFSLPINSEFGFAYYCAGRFQEAADVHWKTFEMDRTFFFAAVSWALDVDQLHRPKDAIAVLEEAPDDTLVLLTLAMAQAAAGQPQRSRITLARALNRPGYADPFWVAATYAQLRDTETAIHWLETAFENRSSQLAWLKVEPHLDPIRPDPRFQKIRERMRL